MAMNLYINARKAALMLLLLMLEEQSYANIMSLPNHLYVLEGDRGTIRCQNRSMDEQTFYSYVSSAVWKRLNANGTVVRIGIFGPIYSSGHTLNFNPFSSEQQGNYYCCLPDESACSSISIVMQSTPPSIRAFNSNYSAVVGSQVTLECDIIALGVPTATFEWNKNGYAISLSHDKIISNSSLALTLRNVTIEDVGVYTCIARNVFSYRNDHIELRVIQHMITTEYPNVSLNEMNVRVMAEDISTTCQIFKISAPVKLERYIYEQYFHNVSVNTTEIFCNDDESTAIWDFQFIGSSAKTAMELFVNDLTNSSVGIDFIIFRLRLCFNCSRLNATSEAENSTDVDKNNDDGIDKVAIVILLVMVTVLIIVAGLLCLTVYLRCRKKRTNIAYLSMQKCVINNESSTLTSLHHYNTLQYKYDTEPCRIPFGTLSLTPREEPSLVHFLPSDGHENHSMQHLTDSSEVHSDHTITTTQDVNSNGYVLPDNFNKPFPNISAASNLTTDADVQIKSTDKRSKATHKPTVILKPDGTEIIQTGTGTLQAVIPSSRSDDYTVTPSQTHESYFDVVKNT